MRLNNIRLALIIIPDVGNNFGTLNSTIEVIRRTLSAKFFTKSITIEDSSLIQELLKIGAVEDNIIVWGYFGYDAFVSALNMKQRINLTDVILATQVVIVDDPPYYSWMYKRLEKLNTRSIILHSSATTMKSTLRLFPQLERSHWFQFPSLELGFLPESKSFSDRPIDLIIPSTLNMPEDFLQLKSVFVDNGQFLNHLFEYQLSNWTETIESTGKCTLELLFEFLDGYMKDDLDKAAFLRTNPIVLGLLERLDNFRRSTHRIKIIKDLLARAVGKVITFDNSCLSFETHAQVSVVPPCSGDSFLGLIQKSKYLFDPGIPGTSGIHQRAKSAMSLHTGLITTSQFFIEAQMDQFWWASNELTAEMWDTCYSDQWNLKVQAAFEANTIYDGSDFNRLPVLI